MKSDCPIYTDIMNIYFAKNGIESIIWRLNTILGNFANSLSAAISDEAKIPKTLHYIWLTSEAGLS